MDLASHEEKDVEATLMSPKFIYKRAPRENPLTNFHKGRDIEFGPYERRRFPVVKPQWTETWKKLSIKGRFDFAETDVYQFKAISIGKVVV